MGELKIKFKLNKIWCYILFLFAFVCVGFTFNSSQVKAFEVSINDGIDYTNKKVSFKVKWGATTVSNIWYCFTSECSDKKTIDVNSYSNIVNEGSDKVGTYSVDISGLDALKTNTSYSSDNNKRKFTLYAYAEAKILGFIKVNDDSDSKTFTYKPAAPVVNGITGNASKEKVGAGDKITFTVALSASSFVDSGVSISFKIGNKVVSATCDNSKYSAVATFSCSYTVKNGESGSVSGGSLVNADKIQGLFNNQVDKTAAGGVSVQYSKTITVDGIKPIVTGVRSSAGVFKNGDVFTVEVVLSETVYVNGDSYLAPTLVVKFAVGENKVCSNPAEITDNINKLVYTCSVIDGDEGVLSFVGLAGGSGISDSSGNALDVSGNPVIDFSNTNANNNNPGLVGQESVSATGCSLSGGVNYCKSGDKLIVAFDFNMNVAVSSKNITFYFDDSSGMGSYDYNEQGNKLTVTYTISSSDDGVIYLYYNITVVGANGKSSIVTNTEKKECNYRVDNSAPVLSDFRVYSNEEQVSVKDGAYYVYSKVNQGIVFKFKVSDASSIIVDSNNIYLLNANDIKIESSQYSNYNIRSLTSAYKDNELVVTVVLSGNANIKLKVLKQGVKDTLGNTLTSDFTSELVRVDCDVPEFEVEVSYPQYKSYTYNNKMVLVGGNIISYKITSTDVDLKDFCVVSSAGEECREYTSLELNKTYEYIFNGSVDGEYALYVKVRDRALNEAQKASNFTLKNMFSYSNGVNKVSQNHSVSVNVSDFEDGTMFKYGWYKKGNSVNFNDANVTSKQDSSFTLDGSKTFNGEYMVCIHRPSDSLTLCSEYLKFDNKIDTFSVNVSSTWTNESIATEIIFNDISTIKCVAVGKNFSDLNCDVKNANAVVYKTSQAISPLTKYVIEENGVYYFYIEDAIGNNNKENMEIVTINNIDKDGIKIDVFNGSYEGEYNTNLELDSYKKVHKFLVTFDKDSSNNNHSFYKYFFSSNSYIINNADSFNNYYIVNEGNGRTINECNKEVTITTPANNGVYNLYIMAKDTAGNVSFKEVKQIKVDSVGPSVKTYDIAGVETDSVGSTSYIVTFEYSFVVEDYESKLDLNNVYYNWIDKDGNKVFSQSKKYNGCPFDYNMCRIKGEDIEFGKELFNPANNYKFELEVYDNAGNVSKYVSSSFKIDTTAPVITTNIEENKWYKVTDFNFAASKENNAGTLDEMAYCLNECGENYDSSKYTSLVVNNPTKDTKVLNLVFKEGVNTLYLYSRDVFGNSNILVQVVNYDTEPVNVIVTNASENVINLRGLEEGTINLTLNDVASGIKSYCVYQEGENKDCVEGLGSETIYVEYPVTENGVYIIEVIDNAGNTVVDSVSVVGIDIDPISFDLSSNAEGKFTNSDVTISVINMRKAMETEVSDSVDKIDYVSLGYDSVISDYGSVFVSGVNSVYNRSVNNDLITSFNVSENKLYIVRITDTAGNVSYNHIKINSIDKVSPFIDTNKDNNGDDKIYVFTSSGNNMYFDSTRNVYNYSNDTMKVNFSSNSLKDLYNGFNNYLGLKICFDDGECTYNTYKVDNYVSDSYLVNRQVIVSAPYNFSGVIRYYLVDGAGNESDRYAFNVNYQSEVSNVSVGLSDSSNAPLDETRKYNSIKLNLSGDNINEIISNNGVKYVLKPSNVNMLNEFANRSGTIDSFLSNQGFVSVNSISTSVGLSNVDSNYYVWVFIRDLLNNYKLVRADDLVKLDTIAPSFNELGLSVEKIDSTNYDLVVGNVVLGYVLEIDANNDGTYEEVVLTNNKFSFSASGISYIHLRLTDEAGNISNDSFSLSSITAGTYLRAYQVDNRLEVDIVVYNLGNKSVDSFSYILTDLNSNETFGDDSINDIDNDCSEYSGSTCVSSVYQKRADNILRITLKEDKKVALYVYVDGNLVKDSNGNVLVMDVFVDDVAPNISLGNSNPTLISTKNGSYTYDVTVTDNNPSNNYKYMLTTRSSSNIYDFENYYNSCISSSTCVRGTFEDDIIINSSSSELNNLVSGNYYLHVYAKDNYGNASVLVSNVIKIDNDAPVISYYNSSSGGYNIINNEAFVSSATNIKFEDASLTYFEIYVNDVLSSVCSVVASIESINCTKHTSGETGFVVSGNQTLYYLDNGDFKIIAYDVINNSKEVRINVDSGRPTINLYKNVNGNYEIQNSATKVFNSLDDLYISVSDNNFNYLTVDLTNTITGETFNTVARYSYNSEVGICISDSSVCEYGKDLVSMLFNDTSSYNKIIIKAIDKANLVSSIEIVYDDEKPVIWTMSVNENVYIDGIMYSILENMTINVEIGVNDDLTLDKLLSKIVLDVDGYTYEQAKNSGLFSVNISKGTEAYIGDILAEIGSYVVTVGYRDEAGNVADSKVININVNDNVMPTLNLIDSISVVEIKVETIISGVRARDNYGLEKDGYNVVREKSLALNEAICSLVSNSGNSTCAGNVSKVSSDSYIFMVAGTYTFVYEISDLSGNTNTISQVIYVSDSSGPNMSSDDFASKEIEIINRKSDGSINVNSVSVKYPSSFDVGDNSDKVVTYAGLWSVNKMEEKYKITDDRYKVSDDGNILTYKFDRIGVYYLRFTSSDKSGNISVFEYEIKVVDKIAPVISGISNGQVFSNELGNVFDVNDDIIVKNGVSASDNYDSNVPLYYEIENDTNHTYKVILKASDSSNNVSSVTVYVDVVDNDKPIVGEIVIDEETNLYSLKFDIIGGEDNSNNFYHEYKVQGGSWTRYESDSALVFGEGLSREISVCIRAVDHAGNISANTSCKIVLVDTTKPVISGVSEGTVIDSQVTINVTDHRLDSVEVYFNQQVIDVDKSDLPLTLQDEGLYSVVAKDTLGNETRVTFMINLEKHVEVINDINASEQSATSVDFDKRLLVKANISYDNSGSSIIKVNLNGINVATQDMLYILGVVPGANGKFVMFSASGDDLKDYGETIDLINAGEVFKQGINNEDCFMNINGDYYAYLIIREQSFNEQQVTEKQEENKDNSGLIKTGLIVLGSALAVILGYQIIKLRKRVRAA